MAEEINLYNELSWKKTWWWMNNHNCGIFIAFIILGLMFIFKGVVGCLFKIAWRLPSNLFTPNNILEGGICDPSKMMQVKWGVNLLNLLQRPWVVFMLLALSFLYYNYRARKRKTDL